MRMLMDYHWPGNVRELENTIERAVVLASGATIHGELLTDSIAGRAPIADLLENRNEASLFEILEECERRIICNMLEKVKWNQTEAAEKFKIPLSTLNQKIKRLNIEIKKRSSRESA
jgi:DNA-binding NtrC family response regulator